MEVMQHKNIAVLGMGRSGIAAARFALNEGARVTAFDQRPLQELDAGVQALIAEGVVFHAAAFALSAFDAIDMVIVSPGVDWNHAVLVALRERGTTVTSEMALALPFVRGKICAITGTNGKSTTTDLLGKILSAGGQRVVVGGNIGIPLLELREQLSDAQWVVLEVSSFQIESTRVLRPDMTIFLNISPDHLDRYGTVAAYIAAKAQLTARLTSDSRLVFNAEDPVVVRLAEGSSAQPFPFVCGRYHRRGHDGCGVARC
jgi:UDP-N-acetylmuramoylalanine--D-glutamate ligase